MAGRDKFVPRGPAFRLRALARQQMPEPGGPAHHFTGGCYLETLGDRFFGFLHKMIPEENAADSARIRSC
jgi:hypothetical protein